MRRALNGKADNLANEAMDAKESTLTRAADFVAARNGSPLAEADYEDEPDEPGPAVRSGRIPLLPSSCTQTSFRASAAAVHHPAVPSHVPQAGQGVAAQVRKLELSSEAEDDENEEDAGDAGSSDDFSDHPQQDEEGDSPDLWDNAPCCLRSRPRHTPSARLVDDSGFTLRASS